MSRHFSDRIIEALHNEQYQIYPNSTSSASQLAIVFNALIYQHISSLRKRALTPSTVTAQT
jgi:hypothetical protein